MSITTKRWQIDRIGEPLRLAAIPTPAPGPGEALVRVRAISLNYRDKLMLSPAGLAGVSLPYVPASDFAGEVIAVGDGVSRVGRGDRVMAAFHGDWIDGAPARPNGVLPTLADDLPGVLADHLVLPESWLVKTPATLDFLQASTLPCAGTTAWTALFGYGHLSPGQTIVLQGTGGVSLFALQLAKTAGAEVIITTRGAAKAKAVRALGADHVIDREADPAWDARVREITAGRGADHVLEMVGGDNLARSVEALAPEGRISMIGVFGGGSATLPTFGTIRRQATIQAFSVGHRRALEDLVRAVDAHGLKPEIDARFPFAEAPAAFARLDDGPFGKIVIEVD